MKYILSFFCIIIAFNNYSQNLITKRSTNYKWIVNSYLWGKHFGTSYYSISTDSFLLDGKYYKKINGEIKETYIRDSFPFTYIKEVDSPERIVMNISKNVEMIHLLFLLQTMEIFKQKLSAKQRLK